MATERTLVLVKPDGVRRGLIGEVISPRFEQPSTRQGSLGWSHQLDPRTALNADFIHAEAGSSVRACR